MFTDYFSVDTLLSAFNIMHLFQQLAHQIIKVVAIVLFAGGWMALSVEGDERSTSRMFRRGYGFGLAMIISGIFLMVFDVTVQMFSHTFSTNTDPLMMLQIGSDQIQERDPYVIARIFIAGYMNLLGYFYVAGGFFSFIKASHRAEGGAWAMAKFWVSSAILFGGAHLMRGDYI